MINTIATAIKDGINAETFSQVIVSETAKVVNTHLEDISDLSVYVVPISEETEIFSRSSDKETYTLHVGLQAPSTTQTELDVYIDLAREVKDYLNRTNYGTANFTSVNYSTLFVPDDFVENGVFTGIITVIYEVFT